ncbi:MAG: PIN domain-containing protein [Chitinispirillia bacterium]|nr:PIN domain-containing protein [Chitinispirillia bacterium]MCL2268845.1 PIN domain-containing protein [Chitinispirillia bacterium]
MKIFIDTNIIVDIVSRRGGYEESLQLLKYCETSRLKGFVSTVTVTDVMYILRKHISPDAVRNAVQTLLVIVDVADVLKNDITAAFSSPVKDFEDAVQASCADRIQADYIVTRNTKDFEKSTVRAILPAELLKRLSEI